MSDGLRSVTETQGGSSANREHIANKTVCPFLFEHANQTVFYILFLNFNFFSFSLFQKKFKVFELGANSSVPLKNIAGDSVAEDSAIFLLLTNFGIFCKI